MLWHGWFALGACQESGPWAVGAGVVARYRVDCALGAYSLDNLVRWDFPEGIEREPPALAMLQHPDVWSDGSMGTNEDAYVGRAGAGVFARIYGDAWIHMEWEHMEPLAQKVDALVLCSLSNVPRVGRRERRDSCVRGCCCDTRWC